MEPGIVKAVVLGAVVASAGTIPWALLALANQKWWPSVPWAVPLAAGHLWFFWRYVRGHGRPRSTAEARRRYCRANSLPDDVWGAALIAGVLGLVALVLFQVLLNRVVVLPAQRTDALLRIPAFTLMMLLVMSALVAGVVEESAFRGYMQGPIERRYGPVVAILVSGSLFGFLHFTHPEVTLLLMPYYLAVAAVYGTLAYLTNSILPGLVLHAGGNMFVTVQLLASGRAEWQATAVPQALVWETGPDAAFWLTSAGVLLATAAAVWAYSALAAVVRSDRLRQASPVP